MSIATTVGRHAKQHHVSSGLPGQGLGWVAASAACKLATARPLPGQALFEQHDTSCKRLLRHQRVAACSFCGCAACCVLYRWGPDPRFGRSAASMFYFDTRFWDKDSWWLWDLAIAVLEQPLGRKVGAHRALAV